MTSKKALIDGDIVTYACGFASDTRTKQPDGTVLVVPEPVEYALHSVKLLLERCMSRTAATERQIYLTGSGNYREKLAVTKPYKGNRDPSNKPTWYKEIKEYLINVHDAKVVDGMEADDAMGIEQMSSPPESSVICSIDKDMNMIPGLHYNWRKDIEYTVRDEDALLFFYTQLLTGDRTDNIQGVPGIGAKRADKILRPCKSEFEMFEAVYAAYRTAYGISDAEKVLMEMANLLWIQRQEGVLWTPPKKDPTE